ncbi:hypothetical protein LCGC14_1010630 [marine sediment metagenome]|uniref:Uncharacterized protein n=1 Tax=marine sediment metagenome TaxID=412755 RepID=A0A0F9R6F4_9ZZZZ
MYFTVIVSALKDLKADKYKKKKRGLISQEKAIVMIRLKPQKKY